MIIYSHHHGKLSYPLSSKDNGAIARKRIFFFLHGKDASRHTRDAIRDVFCAEKNVVYSMQSFPADVLRTSVTCSKSWAGMYAVLRALYHLRGLFLGLRSTDMSKQGWLGAQPCRKYLTRLGGNSTHFITQSWRGGQGRRYPNAVRRAVIGRVGGKPVGLTSRCSNSPVAPQRTGLWPGARPDG